MSRIAPKHQACLQTFAQIKGGDTGVKTPKNQPTRVTTTENSYTTIRNKGKKSVNSKNGGVLTCLQLL
jgi:hypothetical protein